MSQPAQRTFLFVCTIFFHIFQAFPIPILNILCINNICKYVYSLSSRVVGCFFPFLPSFHSFVRTFFLLLLHDSFLLFQLFHSISYFYCTQAIFFDSTRNFFLLDKHVLLPPHRNTFLLTHTHTIAHIQALKHD